MKRTILIIALLSTFMSGFAEYNPTPENIKAREEFQDDKFGIFIHWGLYAMIAHGEWVINNEKLNAAEYSHLAGGFYPSHFDADAWVKTFKDAGVKYITITSRHHDGFSLFGTKASPYNVVDATPFKRDILKELADACQRQGMKLQFYYSHLDWTRDDYPLGRTGLKSGRPTDRQNYDSYLAFMMQQLKELLSNYGPLRAIWFDGWWDHDSDKTPFDWRLSEQYEMIHRLQPSCLVLNNHHQVPFEGEDIQGFEQDLPGENTHGLSGQKITEYPLETCMTMNESWGYDVRDKDYKSSDVLIQNLVKAAGKNCNLLLNVGPRPDGLLPAEAIERLYAIGTWMQQNGETIYGTRGGIVGPHDWGVTTQRGNKLYVHILNHQDTGLYLPVNSKKVKSASMYVTHKKLNYTASGNGITLILPEAPKGVDTIVEITLR